MEIYIIDSNGVRSSGNVDEFGNTVKRTKSQYPYSYDGFITYRNGKNKEVNTTVYSDRLKQYDYEKTDKLKLKHFGDKGDYYSGRSPKKIEAFLSEYLDKEVKIIFIMEYCNVPTGYPFWRFDIKTK